VAQDLLLASTTSEHDVVEKGVFSLASNEVNYTPQQSTCPSPQTAYSTSYSLSGNSLTLATPAGTFIFSRDTNPASTNAVLLLGCFQSEGAFVQAPLAPVSNS
jgi:hypothetical protein